MAYVYLKATEGGTNVDSKYKQNIDLAHRYGLKVGSYHFYRARIPQQTKLKNFKAQCRRDQEWFGNRRILRLTLQVPASRGKGIQTEAAHLYGCQLL